MTHIAHTLASLTSPRLGSRRLAFLVALAVLAVTTALALTIALSTSSAPSASQTVNQVDGVRYDGAPNGHPRLGSASTGEGTAADRNPNTLGQRP